MQLQQDVLVADDLLPPLVKPAFGQETAQAVLDIVRLVPQGHNQGSWEDVGESCGTTRCVAGWVQWLHLGRVKQTTISPVSRSWNGYSSVETAVFAKKALGISFQDATILFFETDTYHAVHALEYLAKGDPIDWDAVMERAGDESGADG